MFRILVFLVAINIIYNDFADAAKRVRTKTNKNNEPNTREEIMHNLYSVYMNTAALNPKREITRRIFTNDRLFEIHVKRLTEVNGLKGHNLRVTENLGSDKNPLVYFDNPIEAKFDHPFLTLEEFKAELENRIERQRNSIKVANLRNVSKKTKETMTENKINKRTSKSALKIKGPKSHSPHHDVDKTTVKNKILNIYENVKKIQVNIDRLKKESVKITDSSKPSKVTKPHKASLSTKKDQNNKNPVKKSNDYKIKDNREKHVTINTHKSKITDKTLNKHGRNTKKNVRSRTKSKKRSNKGRLKKTKSRNKHIKKSKQTKRKHRLKSKLMGVGDLVKISNYQDIAGKLNASDYQIKESPQSKESTNTSKAEKDTISRKNHLLFTRTTLNTTTNASLVKNKSSSIPKPTYIVIEDNILRKNVSFKLLETTDPILNKFLDFNTSSEGNTSRRNISFNEPMEPIFSKYIGSETILDTTQTLPITTELLNTTDKKLLSLGILNSTLSESIDASADNITYGDKAISRSDILETPSTELNSNAIGLPTNSGLLNSDLDPVTSVISDDVVSPSTELNSISTGFSSNYGQLTSDLVTQGSITSDSDVSETAILESNTTAGTLLGPPPIPLTTEETTGQAVYSTDTADNTQAPNLGPAFSLRVLSRGPRLPSGHLRLKGTTKQKARKRWSTLSRPLVFMPGNPPEDTTEKKNELINSTKT